MGVEITLALVTNLIAEQFPQWKHLPIKALEPNGWDNRTFRLGNDMSIRLPSAKEYAPQVQKEQKWLPKLAPYLSIQIPEAIAIGMPAENYPWYWSVYKWIPGESANTLCLDDSQLQQIAITLAKFLNELQKIDVTGGPIAGPHNFYRGAHLAIYDAETRAAITETLNDIDAVKATVIWEKALSSKWNKDPVWVHGDIASGNLLINDNQLTAVIDFGCMGIGDPSCDLMIAWTFFKNESKKIFKKHLQLNSDIWDRACGWALWKALQKTGPEARQSRHILNEIFNEIKAK